MPVAQQASRGPAVDSSAYLLVVGSLESGCQVSIRPVNGAGRCERVGRGARTDLLDEVEDRVGEGRIGERERLGVGLGLYTLRYLVSLWSRRGECSIKPRG